MKKLFILLFGFLMICSLGYLTSCEIETVSCGDDRCWDANPYSNEFTIRCYPTEKECEDDSGHPCTLCN